MKREFDIRKGSVVRYSDKQSTVVAITEVPIGQMVNERKVDKVEDVAGKTYQLDLASGVWIYAHEVDEVVK